jgi:transposase InsO family protein
MTNDLRENDAETELARNVDAGDGFVATSEGLIDVQDPAVLRALADRSSADLTVLSSQLLQAGLRLTVEQIRRQKLIRKALARVAKGHYRGIVAARALGAAIAEVLELRDALTSSRPALASPEPIVNSSISNQPIGAVAASLVLEIRGRRVGKTLAELPESAKSEMADRQEFLLRHRDGHPISEAVRDLPSGRTRSARWGRRLALSYKTLGVLALQDRRIDNGREPEIGDDILLLVLVKYLTRARANPSTIQQQLRAELGSDVPIPSLSWIRNVIQLVPRHSRDATKLGKAEWRSRTAPRGHMTPTNYANEIFEVDDCTLDSWVREEFAPGDWRAVQPYLSGCIDVHSRTIPGYLLSTMHPNGWSVALMLRSAILPHVNPKWLNQGVPGGLRMDNGRNFTSGDVATTLRALGIRIELCHFHAPNEKPYIERWFRTVQSSLLPQLPGYKGEGMRSQEAAQKRVATLLTLEQLNAALERWITEYYHERPHGGLAAQYTDSRPARVWEATARIRQVEQRELDALLLKSETRTITPSGVSLHGRTYACAEFADWVGDLVVLRFHPEQHRAVIAYFEDGRHEPVVAYWVDDPASPYTAADHAAQRARIGAVISHTTKWAQNEETKLTASKFHNQMVASVTRGLLGAGQRVRADETGGSSLEVPADSMPESAATPSDDDESARRRFLSRLIK